MATSTATIGELRASFRRMRDAGRFVFGMAWDRAVEATLAARGLNFDTADPTDWVRAAEATTLPCEKCHATGTYSWGGTINGKPVHTGHCYQCGGSGTQNIDDMFRNRSHTLHYVNRAI